MRPPPTRDRPAERTAHARWGLLAIALITAVALVSAAAVGYGDARDAAESLSRARATDLFRVTRRALRMRAGDEALLAEVLDEFREQGLRYIGVAQRGRAVAEAGEPVGAPLDTLGPARGLDVRDVGARVRAVAPLRPSHGPWMRRGWRGPRPPPGVMVIELEPLLARTMTRGALRLLAVSGAAALLLILGALVFWRLAARAARAEAQLARDRRLAALGEMSAVLGHELRNPLAALKGHAQLVTERLEEGHRASANAARVVHEAQRLELLTGQILDFARTGEVSREPSDPRGPLSAAIAATEGLRPGAITVDAADAPATWPLDAQRITQVLTNVLKNALQASPPDRPVEVRLTAAGDALRYVIRDHGPGFPPGEAEHLFEPFRTRRVHGTGLGLAIARRIVEAHGGRISASDHPDGGAVVYVELPS